MTEPVGADRMIGGTGLVIETIRPYKTGGMVRIGGEEWRAESEDNTEVPEGVEVDVLRVEGTYLVIRPRSV